MTAKRTWSHELGVVGLGFRLKRPTRQIIKSAIDKASMTGMRLIREPENKYDENAIAVHFPERYMHGAHIGYLHRDSAALLAPKIDSGVLEVAGATLTAVSDDRDDHKTATLLVRFRDVPAKKKSHA